VTKTFVAGAFPALLILLGGAHPAVAQAPGAPDKDTDTPFQISVSFNLVLLPVTVRDKKGGFAADLRQQDFEVFEDNVRQSVRFFRHDDTPVTVGLVVDHSGSMQDKMRDVLTAAYTFVRLSNPEDQMFVVNFNEKVTLGLPPSIPFTDKAEELTDAIRRAPAAGQTALYDALDVALGRLQTGDRDKKVLIVVSDGGDNASVLDLHQILKRAALSNAMIYTIGIFDTNDPDQNPGVLKRLAQETGGEAFFPAAFSDVDGICENIAKEIRHQYTLGYVSTNAQPGGHRVIRVVAHAAGKDLMVRTRSSYTAAEEAPGKRTESPAGKDREKK
jgi:Ca-activated chloride channel family protein